MATTGRKKRAGDQATTHVRATDAVSTALVETIAELESVPPTELDMQIYDTVDLGALDTICEDAADDLRMTFQVEAYEITIHGGDTIVVERTEVSR